MASLSRRFSAGATTYAQRAPVQREAARHLLQLIPELSYTRILEPGCGSGYFTRLMHQRWPTATIDAVDVAPGMIALARETFAGNTQVNWQVAEAGAFVHDVPYSLVASNGALHWSLDLPDVLQRLARTLAPDGVFAASLMLRGTLAELHEARLIAAPEKPPRSRLPMREEIELAIAKAGLTLTHAEVQTATTIYPDARTMLRELHDQGVTGGWLSQAAAPLTRTQLDRLRAVYDAAHASPEGGVMATYRIGYFIAESP